MSARGKPQRNQTRRRRQLAYAMGQLEKARSNAKAVVKAVAADETGEVFDGKTRKRELKRSRKITRKWEMKVARLLSESLKDKHETEEKIARERAKLKEREFEPEE